MIPTLLAGLLVLAPPAERAETLHAKARQAARRGDTRAAAALWQQAVELHAEPRYAFNLCNALRVLDRPVEAWEACERALGLPARYQGRLHRLRALLEERLLRTHARLHLDVEPPDAVVTIEDEAWAPGRAVWVPRAQSTVVIQRAGYEPRRFEWRHPIGARHERRVQLRVSPRPPATRAGARPRRRLVEAGPRLRYIEADASPVRLVLGWTGIVAGAAALGTGVALLVDAEGTVQDLADLRPSGTDTAAWNEYSARYDELVGSARDLRTAGWVLASIGAVLAVAGGVALGWPTGDGAASVELAPAAGGVAGRLRF